MILTRGSSICGEMLWTSCRTQSSKVMQITKIPYRNINTGLESPRLGNVGGTMKHYEFPNLEHLVGRWHEHKSENYPEFLRATGIVERTINFIQSHKSWMSYSLNGQELTCSYGYLDNDFITTHTCTLGKPYTYFNYYNGLRMKATYYQDGMSLKEQHVCETNPDFVINAERKLKDKNTMVAVSTFKNIATRKILKRQ